MSATFGNTGGTNLRVSSNAYGSGSMTINAGTNLVAIARVTWDGDNARNVTATYVRYGGRDMTPIGTPFGQNDPDMRLQFFYLVNPPTGSNTFEVQLSGTPGEFYADIAGFTHVLQSNPIRSGSFTSANPADGSAHLTLAIPCQPGDLTVSMCNPNGGGFPATATDQTQENWDAAGAMGVATDHGTTPATGTTYTHVWTVESANRVSSAIGIALRPSAFGHLRIQDGTDSGNTTFFASQRFQMGPVSGVATAIKIAAWYSTPGYKIKMALYADSAGVPGTLIPNSYVEATCTQTTRPTQDSHWTAGSISAALTANAWYHLAFTCESDTTRNARGTLGGNGEQRYAGSQAYGDFPKATAPTTEGTTYQISMYVEYNEGGPHMTGALVKSLTPVAKTGGVTPSGVRIGKVDKRLLGAFGAGGDSKYFGACDEAGNAVGTGTNSDAGYCFWHSYTCPGSGTQHLSRLEADVNAGGQSNCRLRLGIYNSAGTTLLAQTGLFTVTGAVGSDSWQGEDVSIDLQGGTEYILVWASDGGGNVVYSSHVDETQSYGYYKYIDYAAGLPASLPTPDSSYNPYPVRALVIKPGFEGTLSSQKTGGGQSSTFLATLVTAGAVFRALTARRTHTAGTTPTGVVTRVLTALRTHTASTTPTGTVTRTWTARKTLTGTLTSVATVFRQIPARLLASMTPTGTASNKLTANRTHTASTTPTGTLARALTALRTITGGNTPTGILNQAKIKLQNLVAGTTPTATITKSTSIPRVATLTTTATVVKQSGKILVASKQPTGVLIQVKTKLQSVVAGLTPTGTAGWKLTRLLAGSLRGARVLDTFSVAQDPLGPPWHMLESESDLYADNGVMKSKYIGFIGVPGSSWISSAVNEADEPCSDQFVEATFAELGGDYYAPILRGNRQGDGYHCYFGYWVGECCVVAYRHGASKPEYGQLPWEPYGSSFSTNAWEDESSDPLATDTWMGNVGVYANLRSLKQTEPYPHAQSRGAGQVGAELYIPTGAMVGSACATAFIAARGAGDVGVMVRTDVNGNGYLLLAHQENATPSGSDWLRLYRVTDNGATRTQLGASDATQFAAGQALRLWVVGTTLVALRNTAGQGAGFTEVFRRTDSVYTTGYSGLLITDTTTSGDNQVDYFGTGPCVIQSFGGWFYLTAEEDFVVGDRMRVEVSGVAQPEIRFYINGRLIFSAVDTAGTFTSGYPGWSYWAGRYGNVNWVQSVDDWVGGSLVPTGTVVKRSGRTLLGIQTTSGALVYGKAALKSLTAAVGTVGTLIKKTYLAVVGTLTSAGEFSKTGSSAKTLTAGTTPTGVLTRLWTARKTLTGGATPGGTLTQIKTKLQALTASVTPTATVRGVTTKFLTAIQSFAGILSKRSGKTITGTQASTGVLTQMKVKLQTILAGVTPTGTLGRQLKPVFTALASAVGTLTRSIGTVKTAFVSSSATVFKTSGKVLTATKQPTGTFARSVTKSLTASLGTVGTIVRSTSYRFLGTLSTAGTLSKRSFRWLTGVLSTLGSYVGISYIKPAKKLHVIDETTFSLGRVNEVVGPRVESEQVTRPSVTDETLE